VPLLRGESDVVELIKCLAIGVPAEPSMGFSCLESAVKAPAAD
jgi:hypothetical protein